MVKVVRLWHPMAETKRDTELLEGRSWFGVLGVEQPGKKQGKRQEGSQGG